MENDDTVSSDTAATGILQCLRMLAEEAATLHLTRTLAAIRGAIETCASERADPRLDMEEYMSSTVRVLH